MNNVLVTGGSRGIGKAISELFLKNNYHVFAPNRTELDLSNRKSINAFLTKYKDLNIDVIVNCAGVNFINSFDKVSDDEIDYSLQLNLISPLQLIKGFVGSMKEKKYGKIINISSIWSVVSKSGRTSYSISKHGLDGITKTLAIELAPFNILVNTVCPGFTMTEMTKKNNSDNEIKQIVGEIPLGRLALPQEIAELVVFLGSNKNTYITGQKLIIDGGFTTQ
jgi:3-oxoacyl-[acyl-carrier protein] reductase